MLFTGRITATIPPKLQGGEGEGLEGVGGDLGADGEPLGFGEGLDVGRGAADARAVAGVPGAAKGCVALVRDGLFVDVDLARVQPVRELHCLAGRAEDA